MPKIQHIIDDNKLMDEWDYDKNNEHQLDPSKITISSKIMAHWICAKNPKHKWPGRPSNRSRGTGCPYCSGRKVLPEESLESLQPELMKEWDYEENRKINLIPSQLTVGSNKKAHWVCNRNPKHKWFVTIGARTNGTGCPYCAGLKVLPEESIQSLRPDLMKEWDYEKNDKKNIYPYKLSVSSNKKVHWVCQKDSSHTWEAPIHNRSKKNGTGCPTCNGGTTEVGFDKTIAFHRKDLLEIWDYEKNKKLGMHPEKTAFSSTRDIHWRCKTNPKHRWKKKMSHIRTDVKNECPECKKEWIQEHSFGRLYNGNVLWDNDKNEQSSFEYTHFSNQKAWFKCQSCDHSWSSIIANIAKGRECPVCAIKEKSSKGERKIETYLKSKKIIFERETTFEKCKYKGNLRFDFKAVHQNKPILIEFDGVQHYEPLEWFGGEEALKETKKRDQIKNIFCQKEGLNLIRIPYWEFENIEKILDSEIFQSK